MKRMLFWLERLRHGRNVAGLSGLVACALVTSAHAQSKQPLTPAPELASARIKVFTGNWTNDHVVAGVSKPGLVPFRADYEKKVEEIAQLAVAGKEVPGNEPMCIPNGPLMESGFGMEVFADAQQLLLITAGPRVRHIWVDGRPHLPDNLLFPSYEGDSVSHWEGNTLVVDTVGLSPSDEIVFGVSANDDKLHLIERWRMLSPSTLQIQTTVEDEVALSRPWTYERTYSRIPASADLSYCVPAVDRTRGGGFDLTPPAGGYVPPGASN